MAKTKKLTLDVDNLLDQALVLGSSLVYLAKDSSDELITLLENHDILVRDEGKKVAKKMKGRFHSQKSKLKETLKKELKNVIDDLGIATRKDLKKSK